MIQTSICHAFPAPSSSTLISVVQAKYVGFCYYGYCVTGSNEDDGNDQLVAVALLVCKVSDILGCHYVTHGDPALSPFNCKSTNYLTFHLNLPPTTFTSGLQVPDKVQVLSYSNFWLIWIFLFLYAISTITFCFMVSVFFNKGQLVIPSRKGYVEGLAYYAQGRCVPTGLMSAVFTKRGVGDIDFSLSISLTLSQSTASHGT